MKRFYGWTFAVFMAISGASFIATCMAWSCSVVGPIPLRVPGLERLYTVNIVQGGQVLITNRPQILRAKMEFENSLSIAQQLRAIGKPYAIPRWNPIPGIHAVYPLWLLAMSSGTAFGLFLIGAIWRMVFGKLNDAWESNV